HFAKIAALLREQKPQCLGIDPISALLQSGPVQVAVRITKHLLDLAKVEQITVVCTSLLEGINVQSEATPIQVSTIADTWIHLSFAIHAGERNRALTVIKSRGTGHSNQVRELVLSDEGISLADVYSSGGEVLMGKLRWEKEIADELERLRARTEMERRRRELELAEAEAASHAELSARELKARRAELALLQREQELLEKRWT